MNKRTFLTALGSALVAVTAGCAEKTGEEAMSELTDVKNLDGKNGINEVEATRFIDREAGVVLYSAWRGAGGGVTAVPISETNL